MNNTEKEFIEKECCKCKSTNPEDCNIIRRMNGEYDCSNKRLEKEKVEK